MLNLAAHGITVLNDFGGRKVAETLFHGRADERHHDAVVVVVADVLHQLADIFTHKVVVDGVFHFGGLYVAGIAVFLAVELLLLHVHSLDGLDERNLHVQAVLNDLVAHLAEGGKHTALRRADGVER